ncbi:MAG TPA: DUF5947 family protein [Streptosporangiaceae bacterium]|nr:DUF5947 family protein [Streptosporangiaceae bacterium]
MSNSTGLRRFVSVPPAAAPAGAVQPEPMQAEPEQAAPEQAAPEQFTHQRALPPLPGQQARRAAPERCEMCATPIPDEHDHVADLDQSSLTCACRACYLLFTHSQAGRSRYRAVPDRYLADPDHPMSPGEWEALEVPVGLAFFLRDSRSGQVTGFYPSPAGATECRLDLRAWEAMAAAHPLLGAVVPDVEAVLIARGDAGVECFAVPIDACYELAGRMRLHWRGFDGGEEARKSIAEFLDQVRGRSRPLPVLPSDGQPGMGDADKGAVRWEP